MIENFLIIKCIGKDDKLGLKINKEFFTHRFDNQKTNNEQLVSEIIKFLKSHNVKLDKNFSIIVNQGPGSFSGLRISLAIAKGLKISKNIKLFGYKDKNLKQFDQENIENLLNKNLVEKKLINPIYLS
jgi:tRNA threonylcarbamoyladenosine biosynthesis protein TsaB|tara:strand:+ start:1384 stop:1767 length:384 start_codon:yes stop_codon:yes gene_type:complete